MSNERTVTLLDLKNIQELMQGDYNVPAPVGEYICFMHPWAVVRMIGRAPKGLWARSLRKRLRNWRIRVARNRNKRWKETRNK